MSVIRSKRGVSDAEFLATARKLQIFTIQKCVNAVPKRYTFFIATPLADCARRVYENVKRGNSINPVNAHEVQLRRDWFLQAIAELYNLVGQIEVAHELLQFDPAIMTEWSGLISKEIKLVKGIVKSDRERYKSLR